jgi:hypothetical protein
MKKHGKKSREISPTLAIVVRNAFGGYISRTKFLFFKPIEVKVAEVRYTRLAVETSPTTNSFF